MLEENTLGYKLYMARVSKKLSLREVGKSVGLSAMYISDIENGKRIPLKGSALSSLASFYNLSLFQLIDLAYNDTKRLVIKQIEKDRIATIESIY